MYTCVCGQKFTDSRRMFTHRQLCAQLKDAIIRDLQRVAAHLGRVPSVTEYSDLKGDKIPSVAFIQAYFTSWNTLLGAAGLPIARRCSPLGYDKTDKLPASTPQRYYWQLESE